MKKYGIILIVLLAVMIGGALYWLNKDNTVDVVTEEKTTLSPTQVESIEAIGQWEFLAIIDPPPCARSALPRDSVRLPSRRWYRRRARQRAHHPHRTASRKRA